MTGEITRIRIQLKFFESKLELEEIDMGIDDVTFDHIGSTLGDTITEKDFGFGLELCAVTTRSNSKRRSDVNSQIDAIEGKKPKRNIQITDSSQKIIV